jgi:hypothetical protein
LRREYYRRHPQLVQVSFKQFDLCFQIAQGELTPYLELRDIITRIAPAQDELSRWTVLSGARASLERRVFQRIFTECHGEQKRGEIDRFLEPYGLKCEFVHDYNVMYVLSGKNRVN